MRGFTPICYLSLPKVMHACIVSKPHVPHVQKYAFYNGTLSVSAYMLHAAAQMSLQSHV